MISPGESPAPVFAQGSEPDVLFRLIASGMAVVSAPSLGDADECPAGGLVEGAGEARGLDEGLDEDGGGVVALGPVVGQLAADEGEDVGAEVGYLIQGRMRNLGLSMTREVFLAQLWGPTDEAVAGGELASGGGEAEHGEGAAEAVVDGVADLGADQGLVSEVVVAGDELVPEPALAGVADGGMEAEGPDLIEGGGRGKSGGSVSGPKVMGRRGGRGHLGGGRTMRPSLCMASMVTLAIMSLRPPSGLCQPMRRQNSLERAWRLGGGEAASSSRKRAISSVVKSRP